MYGIDLDLLLGADDDVGILLLEAAIRYMLKFTEHVCACVHVTIIWATPQFFLWFLVSVFSFSSHWYIGRAEISIALSLGDFVILKWWVAIFMKKCVLVLNLCSVVWWKIWNTTFVNLICRWVLDACLFRWAYVSERNCPGCFMIWNPVMKAVYGLLLRRAAATSDAVRKSKDILTYTAGQAYQWSNSD